MVKSTDQAASKGISRVDSIDKLKEAVDYAFGWTEKQYVIVEECIVGHEVGMDGFVDDNGKCYCFPHNKITYFNGLANVPIGHSVPFNSVDTVEKKNLFKEVEKGVRALGLRGVFFNTDVMIRDRQSFILEIGGRTGSTCIPDMLSKYCGFNYYEKIIDNAVGKQIKMDFIPQIACAAGFLMARQSGVVKEIDYSAISPGKGIEYSLDIRVGDTTKPFMLGNDRIGQVVCVALTAQEAENKLLEAQYDIVNCIQYK